MHASLLKFIFSALLLSAFMSACAGLTISEALPNTTDDTSLESITVTNTLCSEVFLTGYTLSDLVKTYTITGGSILPGEKRIFLRPETKIALNNDIETVTLRDGSGSTLSTFSWTSTTKGVAITQSVNLENCTPRETSTGTTTPENGEPSGSGGTVTESGTTLTETSTGSTGWGEELSSSGIESTLSWALSESGSTLSGSIEWAFSGSTSSWTDISTGMVTLPVVNCAPSIGSITPWITSAIFMGFFSPCGDLMVELNSAEEYFSGSLTHGSTTFSELLEDTEYQYKVSSLTGSFSEFTLGTFMTSPSDLSPLTLGYSDRDANGKIDTITLTYSRSITGTLDLSKVLLFSQSGGLAERKIDSEPGIVSGYSFSGNDLILSLHEQDMTKSFLRVNSSTSSDLRLKSLSGWWLLDMKWREAHLLTLTTMLDGYRSSRIIHPPLPEESPLETTTLEDSESISSLSGMMMFVALQSPTNAVFDENMGTFTCTGELESCRINPTFEESFTGVFTRSLIRFEYSTGATFFTHADGNPSTLYFPRGTGSLVVRFIEKSSSHVLIQQTYSIFYHPPIVSVGGGSSSAALVAATKYPIGPVSAKIRLQSFTPSRYRYVDWIDGIETLHCVGREYCRVNMTAEDSAVPMGTNRHILWTMPDGKPDFRENLPEFVYGAWVYDFQLVVSDGGSFDRKHFRVTVRPTDPPKVETKVVQAPKEALLETSPLPLIRPKVFITQVMPNPAGKDDQEWLEFSADNWGSLSDCILSSGSRKHRLSTEIEPGEVMRISWEDASISLGNAHGHITITCDDQIIDSVSWSWKVYDNVLLTFSGHTREVFYGERTEVTRGKHKGLKAPKKAKPLPYVSLEANPVTFSLQTSLTKYVSLSGNRITCSTRASTCKVNLTAHGPKWVIYLWSADGSEWVEKKDPRAFVLRQGTHSILLRAFAPTSWEVHEITIPVYVTRPKAKIAAVPAKKVAASAQRTEASLAPMKKAAGLEDAPTLTHRTEWLLFTLTALVGVAWMWAFLQSKKE